VTVLRLRLSVELRYALAARRAQYRLRLEPEGAREASLSIKPFSHTLDRRLDRRGFVESYVALDAPHGHVVFAAEASVDSVEPTVPPDGSWEAARDEVRASASSQALQAAASLGPLVEGATVDDVFRDGETLMQSLPRLPKDIGRALNVLHAGGLAAEVASGITIGKGTVAEHKTWLSVYAAKGRWLDWDCAVGAPAQPALRLCVGPTLGDVAPVRAVAVGAGDVTASFNASIEYP